MPVPSKGPLDIYILPSSINISSISITVDNSSDTFNSSISGEYLLLVTHGNYNWNDTHTVSVSCDGYSTTSGTTDSNGKVYITLTTAIQYISKLSDGTNTYVIKDAEARTSIANKQDTLVSGTNIKTINNQSLLGSGNIDIQSGSDVEAFTAAEVQTIWDSVVPSSFSFIKGSGVTDYTINNQTYTSNKSISLWDGEYTLTISTSSIDTGGLCINDTSLGLTSSCSVIVSGSSITFSNNTHTVSGTSSTNFTLTFGGGGSVN